jgi:hypothetical protein
MELSHCTAADALKKLQATPPPDAVNASLLASIDAALLAALAHASDLDLSHSDLSTGTGTEGDVQACIDKMALHRGDLARANTDYNNAHKEKEFAKIQEIKKSATERKEKNSAALAELEERVKKLKAQMDAAPWRLLQRAWEAACRAPARLVLKNCGLSAFSLAELRAAVAPHVEELVLDGNDLGDRGAEEVAELLAVSPQLKRLAVRNCGFTDMGMGVLAAGLARSGSLQSLDARANGLSTSGAAAAFDAVQRFRPTECLL